MGASPPYEIREDNRVAYGYNESLVIAHWDRASERRQPSWPGPQHG